MDGHNIGETMSEINSGASPAPIEQSNVQPESNESAESSNNQMGFSSGENDLSTEDAIDAAEAAGDISEKEAKERKKILKLKVDGEEFEETVDLDDEEALKKHLQKSKAFDKRLKEFSGYKSQVDQLLNMLQNDPEALLEKMGLNVDELAEKRLSRKIEEMKKSPEQLEREKMEKELEDLRKEKKKAEEERQKAELEKMRNEQAQQIETDISEALDSAKSILPKKNPIVMQRIAQTMLMAMKNGYPEVTAKDVIPLVEKQWKNELNEFFSVVPEEVLEQLVGKNNIDRYRKKRIAAKPKVETKTANQVVKETGKKVEEKPSEKVSYKDFFKNY